MNRFTAANDLAHGKAQRTAVLLVQLGTPDEASPSALRRYLKEFLSDPRVVEIPALVWKIILYGIILNVRPKKSAEKYATVWTSEGSPLRFHTEKQTKLIRGWLGEKGLDVDVAYAMRYGQPSIPAVLRKLRERGLERLLVFPLYPQYAAATSATAMDAVFAELSTWRNQPELRSIKHFHDDPGYINALAAHLRHEWQRVGQPPAHLLMSFHGVPKRSLMLGDPYHCECYKTGRLLAERLELEPGQYSVSFQSRFGKAEWLQPYTTTRLTQLAGSTQGRLDVFCPGFVSDCLETLEEIAIEGREDYLEAGGKEYQYIPCLNESPALIEALGQLIVRHTAGWPIQQPTSTQQAASAEMLKRQREAALALGATK